MMKEQSQIKIDHTIPYNQYVDQEAFNKEKDHLFYKKWIMVGHTKQVEKIGDFFTFDLAGEPLLITRNKSNELSAMYNICPHRGTKVERSENGNKKILQCMYHGWTFHLDGKLNRAPNFGTNELGNRSCLRTIKLEVYQSLIFVNLNEKAQPLSFYYDELMKELNQYSFLDSFQTIISKKQIIHANWKAIVDNYLECDHCKINHPSFSKTFDMNDYHIEPFKNFTRQYSELKKKDAKKQAYFYWIWPNLMISIYPEGFGNMTTSQIIPLAPNKSLVLYNYYFTTEQLTTEQKELMDFVNQVRAEDVELVELLQTGFHSQAFNSGIYSPKEKGLQYFHTRLTEALLSE